MKTALHSVSYAGLWGQQFLSVPDFLEHAHRLGFEAVMLMAKRPHLSPLEGGQGLKKIQALLGRLNLKVACLAGYNDFTLGADRPDIPAAEMQLLWIREMCKLARELECPLVRVFTGYHHPALTFDQQWRRCVGCLKEAAQIAGDHGVTLGVQNHHDTAVHFESLADLLQEIDHPSCQAMFDAWAPALQGSDLAAGVKKLAPFIVHTTVADYVKRPQFHYQPDLVNYAAEPEAVRAVAMGEGFIDYRSFFQALRETGYTGYVAYEMCSPLRGGGGQENLDRCARRFLDYMQSNQQ